VALLVTLAPLVQLATEVLLVFLDLVVSLEVRERKERLDQWDCLDCKASVEQRAHLVLQGHRDWQDSLENEGQ